MKLNIVPARTGFTWAKLGVKTFVRQPLALAGLFFMYMAAVLVLSNLPLIGPLIGGLLVPAATLGLMAATAEAAKGRFPMPSVLLSAFRAGRQRARAMLVLGVLYTGGSLLASVLAGALTGGPAPETAAGPAAAVDDRTLLTLALHTPLMVLFWHAPALVHWHGVAPVKSLFFSAVAILRNFGAMLVYGLAWLGLFILVALVLGTVGALFGGGAAARTVMMPAVLVLVAMFSTSMYFTFRDSFVADEPAALPPAGAEGTL